MDRTWSIPDLVNHGRWDDTLCVWLSPASSHRYGCSRSSPCLSTSSSLGLCGICKHQSYRTCHHPIWLTYDGLCMYFRRNTGVENTASLFVQKIVKQSLLCLIAYTFVGFCAIVISNKRRRFRITRLTTAASRAAILSMAASKHCYFDQKQQKHKLTARHCCCCHQLRA